MGEITWFCSSCGDGPYGDWQHMCTNCSHTRCGNCRLEDGKGPSYHWRTSAGTIHSESMGKSQSSQAPRSPGHWSILHGREISDEEQSGSKEAAQSSQDAESSSEKKSMSVTKGTESEDGQKDGQHLMTSHLPKSEVELGRERRRRRHRYQAGPTQADLVLLREMDPNRPDIAQRASEKVPENDTDSDSDLDFKTLVEYKRLKPNSYAADYTSAFFSHLHDTGPSSHNTKHSSTELDSGINPSEHLSSSSEASFPSTDPFVGLEHSETLTSVSNPGSVLSTITERQHLQQPNAAGGPGKHHSELNTLQTEPPTQNDSLRWIVGGTLAGFKSRDTMRKVRKTAMVSYLKTGNSKNNVNSGADSKRSAVSLDSERVWHSRLVAGPGKSSENTKPTSPNTSSTLQTQDHGLLPSNTRESQRPLQSTTPKAPAPILPIADDPYDRDNMRSLVPVDPSLDYFRTPDPFSSPRSLYQASNNEFSGRTSLHKAGNNERTSLPNAASVEDGNNEIDQCYAEPTTASSSYDTDPIKNFLGLSGGFQEFVAYFGDTLISQTRAQTWIGHALERHTLEEIEHSLSDLLEDYGIELAASTTNNSVAASAIQLIQKHRPQISRYFRSNATSPTKSGSRASQLQRLNKHLSLSARAGLLEKPAIAQNKRQFDREEEKVAEKYLNFANNRAFLISCYPFRRLVAALLGALLPRMDTIELQVLGTLSLKGRDESVTRAAQSEIPEKLHCVFELDWKPLEFLRSQFPNRDPDLGTIVTLTGSSLRAYGTTCLEYIQKTWPRTGAFFLSTIQETMKQARRLGTERTEPYTAHLGSLEIEITLLAESLKVKTRATSDDLVELAQQMSWMSAAMSVSPFGDDGVAYCKANLIRVSEPTDLGEPQSFKIELDFEELDPKENSCWLSLFSNAVIAHGFPVPQRHDEVGLEIPIDLMAALAGVRHAVDFQGGIVMKGFSSMFFPVKRDQDRVQWHLITSSDCDTQLTYWDALQRCHDRALLNEVNLETLRETRAIIGWYSVAETSLGRDDVRYEDIKYSGARIAESSLRFTGGSLGFQQFATASVQFTLGPKDGKRHFQLSGPYSRIVSAAEKRQVILYDTDQKRAWLVRVSEVMLHIAQCRNRLNPFEIDGAPFEIQYHECARETLMKYALSIPSGHECNYFRDMISDIWSRLELLLEENVAQSKLPGTPLHPSRKPMLFGYEFKALVQDLSPLERKQCTIDKTSGGWLSLAQDINAVVLLARGFGEVIRPIQRNDERLCGTWSRLPEGFDYLATSVGVLLDCYEKAGCEQSYKYLTSTRLRWHRGKSLLFEPCISLHRDQCKCDRLQQIWHKSSTGRFVPPDKLEPKGAVIFGRSASALSMFSKGRWQTQSVFYSQSNGPFISTSKQQSSKNRVDLSEGENSSTQEEFGDNMVSSIASSAS